MNNIAVILAGGSGVRLGNDIPKQFMKVAGKMIVEHTIEVFQNNKNIDEICIICNQNYLHLISDLVNKNKFDKVKKVLTGGKERNDSSLAAINAFEDDVNLIFHDAVRPLVNDRIINDVISALSEYDAIDVAIPSTDTIIQSDSNFIDMIPVRSKLLNGQTPQAFKSRLLKKAYNIATLDPDFIATDDCGVVKKYLPNVDIFIVQGEQFNMKLTHKEDLFLLDKLFQLKSERCIKSLDKSKIAKSLDKKVVVVFGGSYGIGKDIIDISLQYTSKVYSFSRSEGNIDISDYPSVVDALQKIYEIEGKIDIIYNTAAILDKEPLINMNQSTIERSIDTNYLGMINVAKASFEFLKNTSGYLFFFTSSSYTRGRSNYSIYSSTKAATVNFTQAIAEEWIDFGIKVNCINPERTKTPMRIKNFGVEDPSTLLDSKIVAQASLNVLSTNLTGQVFDVRK